MTGGRSDLVDIAGTLKAETELAILFDDGAQAVWLPRSQIEIDRGFDGLFVVTLPDWLANDKGLI